MLKYTAFDCVAPNAIAQFLAIKLQKVHPYAMRSLPNEKSRPLTRFSIYNGGSTNKKRVAEAMDLCPFLLGIDQLLEIQNVEYAEDPPDFIFTVNGDRIGVELTMVNPLKFGKGGNLKMKEFRDWCVQVEANPQPESKFTWGKFTLRESLESLQEQLRAKTEKSKKWNAVLQKKWLIMHIAEGSPFGDLVAVRREPAPGVDPQRYADHLAKVVFEVCSIFAQPNPFDYIFIYSGVRFISFARNGQNPYRLPLPRLDLVTQGAKVDSSHFDWTSTITHVKRRRQLVWSSEGHPAETDI